MDRLNRAWRAIRWLWWYYWTPSWWMIYWKTPRGQYFVEWDGRMEWLRREPKR